MSTINDGGPAYPVVTGSASVEGCTVYTTLTGMSVRDHFAGVALQGIIAEPVIAGCAAVAARIVTSEFGPDQIGVMTVQQQLAFAAYRLADAMLAERAKVPA